MLRFAHRGHEQDDSWNHWVVILHPHPEVSPGSLDDCDHFQGCINVEVYCKGT